MQIIMTVFLILCSYQLYGQDKKSSCTQAELDKQVSKQVKQSLDKLSARNIVSFSRELLDKEKEIKLSELEIEKQRQLLDLSIKDFNKRVQDFQKKQNSLLGCIEKQDKDRDSRVKHLVDTIAAMKAERAAQILSVQDERVAIEMLSRLEATKISKIFNLMDKEVSARLQKQYLNMTK